MRTPLDNKMTTPAGAVCPRCGGPARDVSSGWFCQAHGLVLDESRNLRPSPDPISEALAADPEVQAAFAQQVEAEAAYDDATDKWSAALGALQGVRLQASNDKGEWPEDGSSGWRPSKAVRVLRNRERELVDEVDLTRLARESAGERMSRARVRYQTTHAEATTRLGRPVYLLGQAPPGDQTLLIPKY